MFHYYAEVLRKYATFSGRARRAEYWYFVLANIIIAFLLGFIEGFYIGINNIPVSDDYSSVLADIYALAVFLPSLAVGVRRIHDSNKSGWFILLPIYNLYLLIRKGTEGPNRFGPDPLAENMPEESVGVETVNPETAAQ